ALLPAHPALLTEGLGLVGQLRVHSASSSFRQRRDQRAAWPRATNSGTSGAFGVPSVRHSLNRVSYRPFRKPSPYVSHPWNAIMRSVASKPGQRSLGSERITSATVAN